MTDDQANRAIAESLEPTPQWSKWMHDQSWNVSDGGCWMGYRDDPDDDEEAIEIHPRNFFTDPAMRDLLQRKLLEAKWTIWMGPLSNGKTQMQLQRNRPIRELIDLADTYDRLMPLAYIRAHNLTADRLGG